MKQPKVALIHDQLIQYGGAEKTLELVCKIFPDSPVFTSLYKPNNLSEFLNSRDIRHTKSFFMQMAPKYFSPLMPTVFEGMNLRDYDLILSDSSSWAKGVLTKPHQLHISYIHTPPRFLYKYSVESSKRNAWYFRPVVPMIDLYLRTWDFTAAQRPNFLIANSVEVQNRIKKFYARESVVINPPVQLGQSPKLSETGAGMFYLAVGRLVAYKNFKSLVEAFNINGLPLVIAGTGPEENNLKNIAKDNIKFEGKVSDPKKFELIEECLGLVNPVEDEDFGIVPVEAASYGKPILAHRSGGHLETVSDGINGMFFDDLSANALSDKILEFDKKIKQKTFDPKTISNGAKKYSAERFVEEYKNFVMEKWELHQKENA